MTTEPNRIRFDCLAADWDANPGRIALTQAVVATLRKSVPLRPDMKALDFGAGTGLVTLGLLPYVAGITAVDTSGEMLRVLGGKLAAAQITNVNSLLCESNHTPLPPGEFDLVVSSMVMHHLPDVSQMIHRLRPCLRPGGWIALADLESEDGTFHADSTGVYHHGFAPEIICGWLREAGFVDIAVCEAHRILRPSADGRTREYPVFLVTGRVD
jgi:ubiquinone/menaquinone biosynthesis C-methylase UbiE